MFSLAKEKKVLALLEKTAPYVFKRIESLTPIERCQALAVANSLMIAGGFFYGRSFSHAPMELDLEDKEKVGIRHDAVLEFANRIEQIESTSSKLDGKRADDPLLAAYRRELSGCEVAMMTAGAIFHEPSRLATIKSWRLLSKGIPYAREAVKVLQLYTKTHSLEPVVRINGQAADAKMLLSLASTLLPMFR